MKNYKFIYGPIPSRRLGKSLGVSPIPKKRVITLVFIVNWGKPSI